MLRREAADFFHWLDVRAFGPIPSVFWLIVIFLECLVLAVKAAT